MGMFDFVKNAGAKLFGKDPEDNVETYKPLRKHVEEHGIDPSGIQFKVHGIGEVTVSGNVPDQDTREKVVLIVGNVEGVSRVHDQLRVGPAVAAQAPLPGATGGASAPTGAATHGAGDGAGPTTAWTSRTYTVKPGDTLSAIAKAMYGDASKYPRIFEANKPMLKDPDKIYPGQVLRIPQ